MLFNVSCLVHEITKICVLITLLHIRYYYTAKEINLNHYVVLPNDNGNVNYNANVFCHIFHNHFFHHHYFSKMSFMIFVCKRFYTNRPIQPTKQTASSDEMYINNK